MFARIAAFEARYQMGGPVFWVVAAIFFLLTFGATTIDQISIGGGGNVNVNSPAAIHMIVLIMSVFYMFVTTAFVANVIVRDDESGFGPMVRSTPVGKFDYLVGRFTGAFLAACVAFLAVPLGILIGSWMPWVDPETIGPNAPAFYASAYFLYGLVNVFITSAIFFAIATFTRSMMATYIAVVVFLVGYLVAQAIMGDDPQLRDVGALVDPFGIGALDEGVRYWTAAESNTQVPPVTGIVLLNRLIWGGVGIAALVVAYVRFSFAQKGASKRQLRREEKRKARLVAVQPAVARRLPDPRPEAAAGARFWARMSFEARQIFRSPAFFVLVLIGLFNSGSALWFSNELFGTPSLPLTFSLLPLVFGAFAIIPLIIAIFYAGELVWRDKDVGIGEIVDASPLPNWAFLLPKLIALTVVLFTALFFGMVAAILIQLMRGFTDIDAGQYIMWYLAPTAIDMMILAALAIFVQAISPHKYVGWAIMLLYVVAQLTFVTIGLDHPLYNYGATGTPTFSDMNGVAVGGAKGWWLRLYWGGFALLLAVLSHLLWRRGSDTRLKPRLRRLPAGLLRTPGIVALAALVIAGATGGWLYYNMDVLETYRRRDAGERLQADMEKKYLQYEDLPQPAITHVVLDVDLHPAEARMTVTGHYDLVNDKGQPIEDIHVLMTDEETEFGKIDIPGAVLHLDDEDLKYRIYRLKTPLAPGETLVMDWTTTRQQRGIRAGDDDTRLVENGTFLNNSEFAPTIGMNRGMLLTDRQTRRKYGLPPELRMAKLGDESARDKSYIGADWVSSDITIRTDAGQVPIAPGERVSDVTKDGRRTARFVAKGPILNFLSIQSADYEVYRRDAGDYELEVYYDADHDYNVTRMADAMQAALGYYEKNFGPYQFGYARIVEFPNYAQFAQAFAGTMPYSEGLGFIANIAKEGDIDYVTYVTAHEVAHQYWAHQLIGADMQGQTVLSETLAQYSALMVMKQLYGEDVMRRFLKYELDRYLEARGSEAIEELPLMKVENQGYIHYRKGSVVMYLLQDRLGEDRVNAALRDMLAEYRFKGAPYPMSTALVSRLMALAGNDEERELVRDLMERITLWDMKVVDAKTTPLPGGRFETVVTASAHKYHADGLGEETEAPLRDHVEFGLFDARPGFGSFDSEDVLVMERRPVTSGTQRYRFVTDRQPRFAGIDPYNKYVDRNSDDNVFLIGD